jgi:hypothetical protein
MTSWETFACSAERGCFFAPAKFRIAPRAGRIKAARQRAREAGRLDAGEHGARLAWTGK